MKASSYPLYAHGGAPEEEERVEEVPYDSALSLLERDFETLFPELWMNEIALGVYDRRFIGDRRPRRLSPPPDEMHRRSRIRYPAPESETDSTEERGRLEHGRPKREPWYEQRDSVERALTNYDPWAGCEYAAQKA